MIFVFFFFILYLFLSKNIFMSMMHIAVEVDDWVLVVITLAGIASEMTIL